MKKNIIQDEEEKNINWLSQIYTVLYIIVCIAGCCFDIFKYADNVGKKLLWDPQLTYRTEEGREYFRSNIELKNAYLILHPQIVFEMDQKVLRMLDVSDICENNQLQYESGSQEFICEELDWSEAENFCSKIRNELGIVGDKIAIRRTYLLKLVYEREYWKGEETVFYILSDKQIIKVSEQAMERRGQDIKVNFNGGKSEMDKIIEQCREAIQIVENQRNGNCDIRHDKESFICNFSKYRYISVKSDDIS